MESEKNFFPKIEKHEKFPENEKERVLEKEKILSTFLGGKAKKIAHVFALISALTLGYESRAEAPVKKEKTATTIKRLEQIKHIYGGKIWEWQGKTKQDGIFDYYPSFKNSLFEELITPGSSEVSGNFKKDLKITTRFGVFAEKTPDIKIHFLFKKYDKQIGNNDRLVNNLKQLAKDKFVFIVLKDFLKSGGRIESWPNSGHYAPGKLVISVGMDEDDTGIQGVALHELFHYVFDKSDSVLWEARDTGGADHAAISPLQERFLIVKSIRDGVCPLDEDINNLYGSTADGEVGQKIKDYLKKNDLGGIKNLVNSNDFYNNYVNSGMISELSSNEAARDTRDFRLKLSDGRTLRFIENYKSEESDQIKTKDYGGKWGVFIDAQTKDIKKIDENQLFSEAQISDEDKEEIKTFIKEHQDDPNKDRDYTFTDEQLQDLAHLNAYNAAILQQSFRLALTLSLKTGKKFNEVFAEKSYQKIFDKFLKDFSDKIEEDQKAAVKKTAFETMDNLIEKL